MIKVAVCDDDEVISRGVKKVIENHKFPVNVMVDAFTTGDALYKTTLKKRYHIILMDIRLFPEGSDGETGMAVSNKIKAVYPDVLVIFFSGNFGYERELLNFEPFRYLPKPFTDESLIHAVDVAVERIMGRERKFFQYKNKKIYHRKLLDDIAYFCSAYPYLEIHGMDRKDVSRFRGRVDVVEEELAILSNDFVRPGKSFLVNKKYIESYSSKEIIMSNGERIPISRSYRETFLQNIG